MATTNPDTGVGATVAFTTSTFTASILNTGEIAEVVESLDITHLGIASGNNARYMEGDNPEIEPFDIVYQFWVEESPPRARVTDTVTITLPLADSGNGTQYSLQITGIIEKNTLVPPLGRNQVNQGTMRFRPDGVTVTLTPESA